MTPPSEAFLIWWYLEREATIAGVDPTRWAKVYTAGSRAALALGPEDRALVEAYTEYTYAVRGRLEEHICRAERICRETS